MLVDIPMSQVKIDEVGMQNWKKMKIYANLDTQSLLDILP